MIWLILILAIILRLINTNQSLWLDEGAQVLMSQKSLNYILFERSGDFHPPLSYIFFHYWLMISHSDAWLRILPIIFGVATIFIIYKICQNLFSERIALISSLFLSIAPYHIYYSQEIRMYSMAAFFASLSMYFLVTNKQVGYVLATSALLYTHYMGIFLIAAQLLYKKKWQDLGLVFLIYLPWLPLFWSQLVNGMNANQYLPGWGNLLSLDPLKAIPLIFLKFIVGRISFENQYLYEVVAILVLGYFGFLIFLSLRSKLDIKPISFWLFIPIMITWLISFLIPINQPFRLLFAVPAFYILLAVGVLKLEKFWKFGVIGVLLILMSGLLVYYTNPKFQREDWRNATKDIPTDAIFAWPEPFDPYIWYGGKGVGVIKHFPASENEITQNLTNIKLGNTVYFFEYLQDLADPQRIIQQELAKFGYKLKETRDFVGVGFVDLYQR